MRESTKAFNRRKGNPFWSSVIHGRILDIGAGDDPYPGSTVTFDHQDGDANHLSSYFKPCEFDTLHASQSLEDMEDPWLAIADWLKILKPGGHLVITVPSWELYEGMIWPSRYNGAHRSTWSLWQKGSPAGKLHVRVPDFYGSGWTASHFSLIDTNYDYSIGPSRDQTIRFEDGVEAFIEFLVRKL